MSSIFRHPALGKRLRENVAHVIVGKDAVIDLILTALLAGGHVLIEDVPGLGKTLLAKALAKSISGSFRRVQFTPDLLPSDITGVSIFNEVMRSFEFQEGPVFTNILLADEINRATPRTQSSLLEAMEEHQVTTDGATRALPPLFFVIATENPVEQQGVYALPEAQLDRFLMRVHIGYPQRHDEMRIVREQLLSSPLANIEPVATVEEVLETQEDIRKVHVDDTLLAYAVQIAEATRRHESLILGASPRASLALIKAAQAAGYLQGSDYVTPDIVKRLVAPVFAHRLVLKPQAIIGGATAAGIVQEILSTIEVPLATREI